MDRRIEHLICERDNEDEKAAAPTAADTAVQQVPVEADTSLRFADERIRSQLTDAAHPPAAADLSATVRYLASLKNVPVTPQQVGAAEQWAGKTLHDARLANVRVEGPRMMEPATRVINRILDIIAATEVMHHVAALIEGNGPVDSETIVRRAEAAVDRFTGGVAFYRWPDAKETFRMHYGEMPWAPLVVKADDGTVATSYMRNWVLHRDPSQGPAFHRKGKFGECSEYWVDGKRHRPHQAGPAIINSDIEGGNILHLEFHENGELHRPAAKGPAILQTLDGVPALEAYAEHGKLHREPLEGPALYSKANGEELWQFTVGGEIHRDPEEGPAWRRKTAQGESWQYIVNGKLHRDHRDGPALHMVNAEGAGNIVTEYHENGVPHRPSMEGPAVLETDPSGRTVLEIYLENGKLHRDPEQGAAKHRAKPDDTWIEYAIEGQSHRDPAVGPAIVFNRFDGREVRGEEYRVDGELHRPSAEGPAVLVTTPEGVPILEIYAKHGKLHRDPKQGPAWREIKNGVEDIQYRVCGDFHRDEKDGPALIERDVTTGVLTREEYFRDGQLHREDGPAGIARDATGRSTGETWHRQGQWHRDPRHGPAVTFYNGSGIATVEEFYVDDIRHRDPAQGPARIVRDNAGRVLEEEFWRDGEFVSESSLKEATPSNRWARRAVKSGKRNTKSGARKKVRHG